MMGNMRTIRGFLVCTSMAFAVSTAFAADIQLFVAPADGHKTAIAAIASAAKSVDMVMFHLTDYAVVKALIAARKRGVAVRIILDGASLASSKFSVPANRLKAVGADVRGSSLAFSITHEKALVVDGARALIMSMNMTGGAARTRDYGVSTAEPGVVREWESVFAADWANAEDGGSRTPALSRPDLVWSPVNSRARLVALADSAKTELAAQVENLGDPEIMGAFIAAAKRGARVRVLVPECDLNKDPLFNYPHLKRLAAGGVQTRVMPHPSTPERPYIHAKMMLADRARAYVGSVNYSSNSTTRARELGIIVSQAGAAKKIAETFERDWSAAVPVPDPLPADCPVLN